MWAPLSYSWLECQISGRLHPGISKAVQRCHGHFGRLPAIACGGNDVRCPRMVYRPLSHASEQLTLSPGKRLLNPQPTGKPQAPDPAPLPEWTTICGGSLSNWPSSFGTTSWKGLEVSTKQSGHTTSSWKRDCETELELCPGSLAGSC